MPKVAIIGCGLIGRSWTIVFVRAGWDAVLYDEIPGVAEDATALISEALVDLGRHGLVEDPTAAALRISIARTVPDAVANADFVQESTPERIEMKREIFPQLVPSLYTEGLKGRARCLVAHPVNPPHLVPIVELCGAPWTAPETLARAREIYREIGQVPIHVKKEVDGFVLNRLQVALLAEAFRLVEDGVVSPQDLDETIRHGLGLRWAFMGPFETIELNAPRGIPDYCARYGSFFRRLAEDQPPASVWSETNIAKASAAWGEPLDAETHAAKTRWRDEQLAALAAHKHRRKPFTAE